MLRALLCSIAALVFVAGGLQAADEKPEKKDLNKDGFLDREELIKAATDRLTSAPRPADKKEDGAAQKKPSSDR